MVKNGVGLHIETINRNVSSVYHDFFLGLWVAELFYTFALTPAKLAFLAFYWRIFRTSTIKLPIKITAIAVICWAVVRVSLPCRISLLSPRTEPLATCQIMVTVFHCIPVQGFWDKSISASCNIDDRKFFLGSVIPHLVMDLIILALPVPYIKSLQISSYQKFCVYAMFLLGGL